MARTSYLSRRDGRYFMQARFAVRCTPLVGLQLYRASLRTSDFRIARLRLSECLGWFHRMNESVDYISLFEKNVTELRAYLQDAWPISDERLFARRNYEELLRNLNRRAQAAGCEPHMIQPDFQLLLNAFVQQNIDAENYLRKAERVRDYERGRADMQAAMHFGVQPASFSLPIQASALAKPEPSQSSRPVHQAVQPAPAASPVAASQKVPLFSAALDEYTTDMRQAGNSADGITNVRLIVQFLIDRFGDLPVPEFGGDLPKNLDKMLPDIPDRNNIPRALSVSLYARYEYARQNGWGGLKRLTENRLRNGYHNSLSKFFGWLITKGYYPHPKPIFNEVSGKNLASLPRDSFETDELIKLFSLPLFVGCESPQRIWKPGPFFVQSHLYWGYIIPILHGFRITEIGQLEVDDIVRRNGVHYFDLRRFNPEKGRVALEDLKRLKTAGSERLVPVHPLVIELGLLDRVAELKERGCRALFPEWQPYFKPDGTPQWGRPISKSWQYLKKELGFTRKDISAYSARHTYAQYLDDTALSHRARKRAMGHSTGKDIPAGYGSKKRYSTRDLEELMSIEAPEIQFMTERLVQAKREADEGRLQVVKPWLLRSNWSEYYRTKLG